MRKLFILLIFLPAVLLSVDISFYQTDLREALTQLSEMYGVPIIFSSKITGKVTIELYDVSLDTALNLILTGTSYDWVKKDGYYLVGDLRSEMVIYLSEARVLNLKHITTDQLAPYLEPYKDYVMFEESGNTLVVFAGEKAFEKIKEIVEKVDRPGVTRAVLYRFARFTEDEYRIVKKLQTAGVFSFSDEGLTFVDRTGIIAVDDVFKMIEAESEGRVIQGFLPLMEGKESKVEIDGATGSMKVTFLLSSGNVKVSFDDGKTKVESVVPYKPGKIAIAQVGGGMFEIYFGEVVPLVKEKTEEKKLPNPYNLLLHVFYSKDTGFMVMGGIGSYIIGNLNLSFMGGYSIEGERPVFAVSLRDHQDVSSILHTYGEVFLKSGTDWDFSGWVCVGAGFRMRGLKIGGGVVTNLKYVRPQLMTSIDFRIFRLFLTYTFDVKEIERGALRVGVEVRW